MKNKTGESSRFQRPPKKAAGALLLLSLAAVLFLCAQFFIGAFKDTIPISMVSDRSGLVMEPGAKVQLNGVEIGRITNIAQADGSARLEAEIDAQWFHLLTADTTAEIKATTAFGSKYVALEVPSGTSAVPLAEGATVRSRNVTTEVNTVFENLTSVMQHVDAAKLNSTLGAVSTALRGRGAQMGETLVDTNTLLTKLDPVMPTLHQDLRDGATVANTYADVAPDFMDLLADASATSDTVVEKEGDVDRTLTAAASFGDSGAALANSSKDAFIESMRLLVPTTDLLAEYSPEYACVLQQAKNALDIETGFGGRNTGYSLDMDVGLLAGDNPYRYPDHLPKVQARGGPGGAPGCYPEITKDMYPTPHLVTDTGSSLADSTSLRVGSPYFMDFLFGNVLGGPAPR